MINVGIVKLIPIKSIVIGERARSDLGDLQTLDESMKKSGQIQPLAVKDLKNGEYLLLAGERRYTVLLSNGVEEVSARIYEHDLSKLEMLMIEEAENFYRKDFEYHEHDALIAKIHKMQQELHGTSAPGPGNEGHKLKDTAEMFGISNVSVHSAIKRAEAREAFPELFEGCRTQKDATNVLKKIDEAAIKQSIAEKVEREKNIEPSSNIKLINSYILGDFFKEIKEIPDGVMHLVEIDPPYAIAIKETKRKEGESIYDLRDYNEVSPSDFMNGGSTPHWKGMNRVFKECYRVMTDHSWLICWFGPEPWFGEIYNAILKAGFQTVRLCGIWTKPCAQSNRPEMHLANSYEMFFYAWKGRPALNKAGRGNIFNYPPVPHQQKTHPTERPVELVRDIYSTFAFPGSRILIPFLGSGNGLVAAYQIGMTAFGFELSKAYRDSFIVKVHNGVKYLS